MVRNAFVPQCSNHGVHGSSILQSDVREVLEQSYNVFIKENLLILSGFVQDFPF